MIEHPYELPDASVSLVVQEHPVQLLFLVPLRELGDLCAHEGQLFSRMRVHVNQKTLKPLELVLVFSRHLVQKRLFPVDHLIVRDRKYVVFTICIGYGESQLVVDTLPEKGIRLEVVQHVVHPPHVPLEIKPEASH